MNYPEPMKFGFYLSKDQEAALDPLAMSPHSRATHIVESLSGLELTPRQLLAPDDVERFSNELRLYLAMLDAQIALLRTQHDHIKPNGMPRIPGK